MSHITRKREVKNMDDGGWDSNLCPCFNETEEEKQERVTEDKPLIHPTIEEDEI